MTDIRMHYRDWVYCLVQDCVKAFWLHIVDLLHLAWSWMSARCDFGTLASCNTPVHWKVIMQCVLIMLRYTADTLRNVWNLKSRLIFICTLLGFVDCVTSVMSRNVSSLISSSLLPLSLYTQITCVFYTFPNHFIFERRHIYVRLKEQYSANVMSTV